jgi:hypothetical protein
VALFFAFVDPAAETKTNVFDRIVATASAIGTVGAVWAALILASRQARVAEQQAMERALLVASGMSSGLHDFKYELHKVLYPLITKTEDDSSISDADTLAWHARLRDLVYEAMSNPIFETDLSRLEALLPLENHSANRIHALCMMAEYIKAKLTPEYRASCASLPRLQSMMELGEWTNRLMFMSTHLDIVIEVIKKAALNGMPDLRYEGKRG